MISRRGFIAGSAGFAFAGDAMASTPLRGADLVGDIALLRDAYETLHPGLYRHSTPTETSARFDALAQAWAQDQSRADAYLSLSRFLATIRCGHSYANFYNQSDTLVEELFAGANRLPFSFVWLGSRMVVTRNLSDDPRLAPGAEILAVNGMRSEDVLRELVAYARADGGNDAKRRSLLEVRGDDAFETFDIFYGLLHPEARDGFSLRVRPPGAWRTAPVEVGAIDLAQRRAAASQPAIGPDDPAWRLTYPREHTAQLLMPSWALYNSRWDWQSFLDASFEELQARGVTRLIVDLRGNEGGLDCGHSIIARLIDTDLPLATYERRVRYRQTPERLNRYLDTWDDSFRSWGEEATPIDDRFYALRSSAESQAQVIAPKGPRFRGELIVLIDSSNSSATFQFANIVRTNGLGRLIGAPTGGNLRGINGGAFFFLRLPASGLECDLPLIGTFPPQPAPDAGLEPDMLLTPTIEDIAAGRDGVLERVLTLTRDG